MVSRADYPRPPGSPGRYTFVSNKGEEVSPVTESSIVQTGTDHLRMISNADIYPGSSIVFSEGGFFWGQAEFPENQWATYPHDSQLARHFPTAGLFRSSKGKPRRLHFPEAISLFGSLEHHFGHFALGILPRLRQVLRRLPEVADVPVLVSERVPLAFRQLLREIGLTNELVEVRMSETAHVQRLFQPDDLSFFPDHLLVAESEVEQARAFHWAQFSSLFSEVHDSRTGIVSLLRGNSIHAPYRTLRNHESVDALLAGLGAQSLNPGTDDFAVMRRSLSAANVIVVELGSVLANVLLAGVRGAAIYVLCHPHVAPFQHSRIPGLLALAGNDVTCIEGSSETPAEKQSDWTVDTRFLSRLLPLHV